MRYDAVVLDLDGTLLNTLPDITRVVNGVIADIGMAPVSRERIRSLVGSGVEALLEGLGVPGQWNAPLSEEISSRYARMNDPMSEVFPGVSGMLDALFKWGGPVCVLSNKTTAGVRKALGDHFSGYPFSAVRGSVKGRPAKPSPDVLLEMLSEVGAAPERAVMAGDGETDVKVAAAAGTVHIACLWGYRERKKLERAGASVFAESPLDVLRILGLRP